MHFKDAVYDAIFPATWMQVCSVNIMKFENMQFDAEESCDSGAARVRYSRIRYMHRLQLDPSSLEGDVDLNKNNSADS